jgi:hypothetical protein
LSGSSFSNGTARAAAFLSSPKSCFLLGYFRQLHHLPNAAPRRLTVSAVLLKVFNLRIYKEFIKSL